jgi:hypothetical protein
MGPVMVGALWTWQTALIAFWRGPDGYLRAAVPGDWQGVDQRIAVERAGAHRLDLRYAAEGDATRRIVLGGRELAEALAFPATQA